MNQLSPRLNIERGLSIYFIEKSDSYNVYTMD